MRAITGYVHQDDVLPATSTVWEFLSLHAALRLPGADAEARGARVWQVPFLPFPFFRYDAAHGPHYNVRTCNP